MFANFSLRRLSYNKTAQSILCYAAYIFMRLLFFTIRCRVLNAENIESAKMRSQNCKYISPIWHQNILSNFYYFSKINQDKQFNMVSFANDGKLLSRLIHLFGWRASHGGSSRGGAVGLRHVARALMSEDRNYEVYVSGVDGPKGPIYEPKMGVIKMAQIAQVPIVPLVYLPSRSWKLKSWDRFRIPKPFSLIYVAPCLPIMVDKGTPKEMYSEIAERIKHIMLSKENEIRDTYSIKD